MGKQSVALHDDLAGVDIIFKRSTRRKTLGLKVRAGEVVVSSPVGVPKDDVLAWVNGKVEWILKHSSKHPSAPQKNISNLSLTERDELFWLGERIALGNASLAGISCIGPAFFDSALSEQKALLLNECAVEAKKDLIERIDRWQEVLKLYPKAIKLRPYKSCWGSCNRRGLVALNTLLMMAPSVVRDYVVVHELCHLKHLNHSPKFWAEVATVFSMPEVRRAKQWLKVHGEQLLFIYR